jgi:uncharacterized membrane protein YuzA (DUF378 family)
MILGCIAHAASWVLLGAALVGYAVPWCLVGFALLSGFARAAYATPFSLIQYDMGADSYMHEFLYALIPLAAAFAFAYGTVSAAYALFGIAALMMVSAVFLLRFEAYEEFSWYYRDTFGMLLEPVHRGFVTEHLLKGYEGAALFVVWPMFVYLILYHSYLVLGILFTVSLLGLSALRPLTAHWRAPAPSAAAALAGGAWLARMVFVQIGTFNLDVRGRAPGPMFLWDTVKCEIDGNPAPAFRSMVIRGNADSVWTVEMEFMPK